MTNAMLQALAGRIMFVVYREFDKSPVHPVTLLPLNAQDSANWMTPEYAQGWVNHLGAGYGVGMVLHPGCGIACVDIDSALQDDGNWSPLAIGLCQRFAGAAIEVSMSGRGLHIFFTYTGEPPEHKTKNTQLHIEFYTQARYIALTGTNLVGSVATDCTALLPQFVAQYFSPAPPNVREGEWSHGPLATWNGPADDDELIHHAYTTRSQRQIFGGKLTFRQLFDADMEALARAFPHAEKPYDASSADQALANHLAFWTGCDCERMARIMRRSALVRDKWEREDYFRGTIINAAKGTTAVYDATRSRRARAPDAAATAGGLPAPDVQPSPELQAEQQPLGVLPPPDKPWDAMTAEEQAALLPKAKMPAPGSTVLVGEQIALWDGYLYVEDVHMILGADGVARDQKRFDAMFGGLIFVTQNETTKPVRSAWECFLENEMYRFPRVRGMRFDPLHKPGSIIEINGERFANSYRPIEVPRKKGSPGRFVRHIEKLLPQGDDAVIFTSWCAGMIQYKGHKPRWCPLLQGAPGNGKSSISRVLAYCVGQRYVSSPKAKELASRFNGWAEGVLLVIVEDVYSHGHAGDILEVLKPMITEESLEIERKGVDKVMRHCPFGMLLNSNHKDAIRKTDDDRRFAIFYTAQQTKKDLARDGLDTEYFQKLNHWLEHEDGFALCHEYLATYDIPEQYDFTKGALIAPLTSSLPASLRESEGFVEQEVRERIEECTPGFAGGWINGNSLKALLSELGSRRVMSRTKRIAMLQGMGYILHPALPQGRIHISLNDGTRPQLFVLEDSPLIKLDTPAKIRQAYEKAQTPA